MKMLKLIVFLTIILCSISAKAEYITCNPDTTVQQYAVRFSQDNGVTWGNWLQSNPVNSAMMHNISTMTRGEYRGEAIAGAEVELTDTTSGETSKVWRWSTAAGFTLRIRSGNAPAKLKVTDQQGP